jgi:hypothetical protein
LRRAAWRASRRKPQFGCTCYHSPIGPTVSISSLPLPGNIRGNSIWREANEWDPGGRLWVNSRRFWPRTVASAAESEAAETEGMRTYAVLTAGFRLAAVVSGTEAGPPLLARSRHPQTGERLIAATIPPASLGQHSALRKPVGTPPVHSSCFRVSPAGSPCRWRDRRRRPQL